MRSQSIALVPDSCATARAARWGQLKQSASRLIPTICLPFLLISSVCAQGLTSKEQLGKFIFFDENLSLTSTQSCAACHGPNVGFTGPNPVTNAGGAVYEGSVPTRFGNRKPPSAAYATPSPILHYLIDKGDALFVGGNFWDGRATGSRLGSPAAEQALGPFLNPVEQALPDNACVVYRVLNPGYQVSFESVWGTDTDNIIWPADVETQCATESGSVSLSDADRAIVDQAYDRIGLSIAAYEASSEVNSFTSKFDYYLKGMANLTKEERLGLNMFQGKGKCANCHVLGRGNKADGSLFTDFTFDNIGVPKNPDNPVYTSDSAFVDLGLGGFLSKVAEWAGFAENNLGKQKVPTLRNVDKRPDASFVKAYTHNGYFKTLEGLVNFYNTRDVKPRCSNPFTREHDALVQGCWPAAEFPENVNDDELGNLHLTPDQEAAIVAFLKTLSDGYEPGP